MSWLYSRALVAEYSAGICSDGGQSAPSSGSLTPQAYLSHDKMNAFSRLSRSGMTCKLLTRGHGEALLTSYLAAFHARTSALQEKAQGFTASDRACGGTWQESLMRYDRDSHSWKTHRCLFDEVLAESSVILPKSGIIVDGVLWELTTSERRTVENEYGFWPTPSASDNRDRGNIGSPAIQRRKEKGKQIMLSQSVSTESGALNPDWVEWLMGWPIGWTDLKPLGTARFQRWQQQHF